MAHLSEHPTVKRFQERMNAANAEASRQKLDARWLRELCIGAGADDVGFVEVDRPELSEQRAEIRSAFPHTKTLVSFVCRMNREDVRNPARSIANLEFHRTGLPENLRRHFGPCRWFVAISSSRPFAT